MARNRYLSAQSIERGAGWVNVLQGFSLGPTVVHLELVLLGVHTGRLHRIGPCPSADEYLHGSRMAKMRWLTILAILQF